MGEYSVEDKWAAFGITMIAGLAALIGAFAIFCIKKSQLKFAVPITLAFSTGVLIHITFLHLIVHAIEDFEYVLGGDDHHHGHHHRRLLHDDHDHDDELTDAQRQALAMTLTLLCISFGIFIMWLFHRLSNKWGLGHGHDMLTEYGSFNDTNETELVKKTDQMSVPDNETNGNAMEIGSNDEPKKTTQHNELQTISYGLALSLVLHHFPEGVATYVSLVYEFDLGILVALALALHDIPCGISLSVTTFVATQSYWKPFLYCGMAAIAYPIGAFVGWIIVEANQDSELLAAILFGCVSGIILYLTLVQLFPATIKTMLKANHPKVTRYTYIALFVGLLVMEICAIILAAADVHTH